MGKETLAPLFCDLSKHFPDDLMVVILKTQSLICNLWKIIKYAHWITSLANDKFPIAHHAQF